MCGRYLFERSAQGYYSIRVPPWHCMQTVESNLPRFEDYKERMVRLVLDAQNSVREKDKKNNKRVAQLIPNWSELKFAGRIVIEVQPQEATVYVDAMRLDSKTEHGYEIGFSPAAIASMGGDRA